MCPQPSKDTQYCQCKNALTSIVCLAMDGAPKKDEVMGISVINRVWTGRNFSLAVVFSLASSFTSNAEYIRCSVDVKCIEKNVVELKKILGGDETNLERRFGLLESMANEVELVTKTITNTNMTTSLIILQRLTDLADTFYVELAKSKDESWVLNYAHQISQMALGSMGLNSTFGVGHEPGDMYQKIESDVVRFQLVNKWNEGLKRVEDENDLLVWKKFFLFVYESTYKKVDLDYFAKIAKNALARIATTQRMKNSYFEGVFKVDMKSSDDFVFDQVTVFQSEDLDLNPVAYLSSETFGPMKEPVPLKWDNSNTVLSGETESMYFEIKFPTDQTIDSVPTTKPQLRVLIEGREVKSTLSTQTSIRSLIQGPSPGMKKTIFSSNDTLRINGFLQGIPVTLDLAIIPTSRPTDDQVEGTHITGVMTTNVTGSLRKFYVTSAREWSVPGALSVVIQWTKSDALKLIINQKPESNSTNALKGAGITGVRGKVLSFEGVYE